MFGSIVGGLLGGLGSLFGGNEAKKAANRNNALLDTYNTQGNQYIDQGSNAASGYLGQVGDLWKGLADQSGGLSGLGLYGDALGVNGAEGNQRATDAFQAGPGYQFQMDQGLDALGRSAASQGRLSSGQTGLDTINYASGLANNEYQNWLNNLSGFGQQQAGIYTGATTGQAGALSDLANLATNTSGQKIDLLGNITNGKMGVNNAKAQASQQQISGGLAGLGQMAGGLFGGYL